MFFATDLGLFRWLGRQQHRAAVWESRWNRKEPLRVRISLEMPNFLWSFYWKCWDNVELPLKGDDSVIEKWPTTFAITDTSGLKTSSFLGGVTISIKMRTSYTGRRTGWSQQSTLTRSVYTIKPPNNMISGDFFPRDCLRLNYLGNFDWKRRDNGELPLKNDGFIEKCLRCAGGALRRGIAPPQSTWQSWNAATSSCRWNNRVILSTKSIILNTKSIISNTKSMIYNTKSIILNTKSMI